MAAANFEDQDTVPPGLTAKLSEAYDAMVSAGYTMRAQLLEDAESGFKAYVPTFSLNEVERMSAVARQSAIDSMLRFTIDETASKPFVAGLVCASPDAVTLVDHYNTAKAAFKKVVIELRNAGVKDRTSSRNTVLKQAMKSAGLQTLHLRECYRQTRIMPPRVESWSWTWATSHARIQRVSFEQALEMVADLRDRDSGLADIAEDLLRKKCDPGQSLVRKVALPNQLRANYAFRDGDKRVRNNCPISGPVILQQHELPRLVWRADPGPGSERPARLPRESIIEADPVVEALSLYRYAQPTD